MKMWKSILFLSVLTLSFAALPLFQKSMATYTPFGAAIGKGYVHSDILGETLYNKIGVLNTAVVSGKGWISEMFADADCDVKVYARATGNPSYVTPVTPPGYIMGGPPHVVPSPDSFDARYYIPKASGDPGPPTPPSGYAYNNTQGWGLNTYVFPSDSWIVDQAIHVVDNVDPNFMYIILANLDEAGHFYGSFQSSGTNLNTARNYDAMRDQLYLTDQEVGRFMAHLAGIYGRLSDSLVIVTSDHGMSTMKMASKTVDIRGILANAGIAMRANDRSPTGSYNPSGHYDWVMSEGCAAYIYSVASEKISQIESTLENYLIDGQNAVWAVLTPAEQTALGLYHSNYNEIIWPTLIVIMNPNYMCPIYYDELAMGVNAFMVELPLPPYGTLDVSTFPGAHGTYTEQNVPLILSGAGISAGTDNSLVATLDIIPTICSINGWSAPAGAEGSVLPNIGSSTKAVNHVYVIALDGMRSDYYNYSYAGLNPYNGLLTPNLAALASSGRVYTNCKSVLTALTGTNHVGIITSKRAGSSGILGVGAYYAGLNLFGGSVGGVVTPIDKLSLLAPYFGLASVGVVFAAVTVAIYIKRVKREKEKQ